MVAENNKGPITRNRPTDYSTEQVERSLLVLAHLNGNATKAERVLADEIGVSRRTLTRWRNELFPDEYERLRRDVLPAIRERQAERLMDAVEELGDLEAELIRKHQADLELLKPAGVSTALRNASVSKGINLDKAENLVVNPEGRAKESFTFEQGMHALREMVGVERLAELLGLPKPVEAEVVPEITDRGNGGPQ